MGIFFGKDRTITTDRTAKLLTTVEQELGSLKPYLEIMRRQIAGAMEVADSSVLGVIERINLVHGLSSGQVDRLEESMQISKVLVEVATQQSGNLNQLIDLVKGIIQSHLTELDSNIQRTGSLAEEISDLKDIMETVGGIAIQSELLGINALIQAAHVRQAGAAFSVVASEMRKLSAKAAQASLDIDFKINKLAQNMASEIESMKRISVEVQATAVKLDHIIQDIRAFECQFAVSTQNLNDGIDGIHANNSQIVAKLTEALGLIQFTDMVYQRMDHVDKALLELHQHTQTLIDRMADEAWEGALSPTLEDRLEQHRSYYVMTSQTEAHDAVLNGCSSSTIDGPAIELF
jgi:methyl-accepting chemotaxis protein